jgi:peptide/nickel transport system substrate-binding protein
MVTPNQVNDDSTLGKYDLYFTGWGIGPDPDFQLSINQCSSRPNADGSGATSENNWCDPAFDALYKAQHTELDATKRADLVKQAFTMIDKAAINSVIWYADTLEAWRSDKFTGFVKQPENGGVVMGQNGYWGLYGAAPVSADTSATAGTTASSGMPGWAIGLIIAAVIVVIGAIILLSMRRRATAADRE